VNAKWLANVSWRDALVIGVPVFALVAVAFWIASRFVEPAPPNHLVMATGVPGGTYQRYGEQYRRYLADLLRRRDLTLMNLVHAPAYAKRHGKLTALTVPRGVVDIEADLPPRDVSIVAVTANLLARNEVHPALTYLLLDTAVTVNSGYARLAEAGTFPNARGQDVPVAEEAERYYKSGKPFL